LVRNSAVNRVIKGSLIGGLKSAALQDGQQPRGGFLADRRN